MCVLATVNHVHKGSMPLPECYQMLWLGTPAVGTVIPLVNVEVPNALHHALVFFCLSVRFRPGKQGIRSEYFSKEWGLQ